MLLLLRWFINFLLYKCSLPTSTSLLPAERSAPNQTASQFKILNARLVDCVIFTELPTYSIILKLFLENLETTTMAMENPKNSNHGRKKGSIELILGPMFSGKSTELMRRLKRYQVIIFLLRRHKFRISHPFFPLQHNILEKIQLGGDKIISNNRKNSPPRCYSSNK